MKVNPQSTNPFPAQLVPTDDPMTDAVIVTPTVEMVGINCSRIHATPDRKRKDGSPVSVISNPEGSTDDCDKTPSRRPRRSRKAYGKGVVRDRLLETEASEGMGFLMHPIVIVGEDGGAEVTLDRTRSDPSSLSVSEHTARRGRVAKVTTSFSRDVAALLDTDISPSPLSNKTRSLESIVESEMTSTPPTQYKRSSSQPAPDVVTPSAKAPDTPKTPFGPKLCCGTWRGDDGDTTRAATQESIEETICGLLGNPIGADDFCDGWQAFSYFMLGPDTREGTPHLKQDIRQALRNRACDMNDRSRRIMALRDNLDPFNRNHGEQGPTEAIEITRKQSFCVADHAATKAKIARNDSSEVSGSIVTIGSMWDVVSCIDPKSDSPAIIRSGANRRNSDLCYDSDPEDISRRHRRKSVIDEEETYDVRSSYLKPKRLNFDFHYNDTSVKDQVKEMLGQRMTLIWHRGGESTDDNVSPIAVKAWIEHGHRLRSTLIQPKFMWKPVNESYEEKASLGITSQNLHSIDLLDFLRVLEADRTDTRRYALAKRSHSLLIESMDHSILFETNSRDERDRIVHGLKLVVARLGSKVVAGEQDVFEEFFGFIPVTGFEDSDDEEAF